jgi:DNA-binding MarR family transcriptional regulator
MLAATGDLCVEYRRTVAMPGSPVGVQGILINRFIIYPYMKKIDLLQRFGFVVNEVGRLYGRQFDQLSREELGLSRAQCRLIGQVAYSEDGHAPTQAEIAQNLDLTPMAVATLVDRMEAAGWIARRPSTTDRRANAIELQPRAQEALGKAMAVSDRVQDVALAGFSAGERQQLVAMLQRVRANLQAEAVAAGAKP